MVSRKITKPLGTQANKALPLGGPGSGHWGHAGRPGQRGGSLPADVATSIYSAKKAKRNQDIARLKLGDFDRSKMSKDMGERAVQVRKAFQGLDRALRRANADWEEAKADYIEAMHSEGEAQSRIYNLERSQGRLPEDQRLRAIEEAKEEYEAWQTKRIGTYAVAQRASEALTIAKDLALEKAHAILGIAAPPRISGTPIRIDIDPKTPSGYARHVSSEITTAKTFLNSFFRAEEVVNGNPDPAVLRLVDSNIRAGSYNKVNIIASARSLKPGTLIHELGHYLEKVYSALGYEARAFLERRTRGNDTVPLNDLKEYAGYGADEVARADKFINPYMGKIYTEGSTEIVSMGLEYLYTQPTKLASQDPDYFDFLLSAIWTDVFDD